MKILVFAHDLVLGGTTVNAIELAAALRDLHGHEVVLFGTPGPMVRLVEEKGLRYLPAPFARMHPSPARVRALTEAVRRERPDLLQVWETWPCLDALYAVHYAMRLPMILTDMLMHVTRVLPKSVPTTFGTPELADRARATGHRKVDVLVPPVDVRLNAPGAVDPATFRAEYAIADRDIALVTVSRLAETMKGESLFRTIESVRRLGRDLPVRLFIVGDGELRSELERSAGQVNAELGRRVVVLTGALLDPRPAYAAADIVIGMGGSALRGMAFGKPVVIVGEQGFSAPLTPETAESFYYKGIFGRGNGDPESEGLIGHIRGFAEHPSHLPDLGAFSRRFVQERFSLEAVSARLAAFCQEAVTESPRLRMAVVDGLRTAGIYLREGRFLWHAVPPEPISTSRA